jgi:hypothetical protein
VDGDKSGRGGGGSVEYGDACGGEARGGGGGGGSYMDICSNTCG